MGLNRTVLARLSCTRLSSAGLISAVLTWGRLALHWFGFVGSDGFSPNELGSAAIGVTQLDWAWLG